MDRTWDKYMDCLLPYFLALSAAGSGRVPAPPTPAASRGARSLRSGHASSAQATGAVRATTNSAQDGVVKALRKVLQAIANVSMKRKNPRLVVGQRSSPMCSMGTPTATARWTATSRSAGAASVAAAPIRKRSSRTGETTPPEASSPF